MLIVNYLLNKIMKKLTLLDIAIVASLGLSCVLCVGLTSVFGADETATETPTVSDTREANDARIENRAERRETITDNLQDRIINLASNVTMRLSSALERMDNISLRLESRMKKLEGLGVDTAPARTKLNEAHVAIEAGKSKLAHMSSISDAIRGGSPRDSFARIRPQFVEVRDIVRQSHTLLKETVSLLKDAIRASDVQKRATDATTEGQGNSSTTE